MKNYCAILALFSVLFCCCNSNKAKIEIDPDSAVVEMDSAVEIVESEDEEYEGDDYENVEVENAQGIPDDYYESNQEGGGSELVEPEIPKKIIQCPICYGSGRCCGGCGGGGVVWSGYTHEVVDCPACNGTGRCGYCDGAGVAEVVGW